MAQGNGGSHVWRKMIKIREEVEYNIWWQIKSGVVSFWFDNWTKQGVLYYVEEDKIGEEETEVRSFIIGDQWDKEKFLLYVSEEMTEHIINNISPVISKGEQETPWWTNNANGRFSVKSAWELMRKKKAKEEKYTFIWRKELPFKINFFLWRAWKGRIATDDNLRRMRINIVSRCWCCETQQIETMSHLFLTASIAQKLWRAIPALILWSLWKRRNHIKHGGQLNLEGMVKQVTKNIQMLTSGRNAGLNLFGKNWLETVNILGNYKPKIYYHIVQWNPPRSDQLKCNTDGASKGNP
ncbi:hypothetical protein KY290_001417 [Solanum tuberosum]|uniref:Reverse transcriptase zinc-binding domain-containing protein n=1 Tax=Solanum tuberosum TaxID=4113 RepID=A0ABQ7WM93_SOLTU|nr:hypothetical protein KY289_001573 [Solanum tuberosum]KAH0781819.1 hypothetical protein KY290_001417 [Solanum tuberosum]